MIDGSHLPFEENAALSHKTAEMAHHAGLPVEAELGTVGGKEDDREADPNGGYTNPSEAAEFVEKTKVDFLAVGIGTAHGFYAKTPKLDIKRLAEINARVSVPLVLHGATGIADDVVIECIRNGICKINYATELRAAFTAAVREALRVNPDAVDVKIYSKEGRNAVMEMVKHKIKVSGSEGMACC
jgi:tagatose 1,6-diphosphate aldolase GatY/KbaY